MIISPIQEIPSNLSQLITTTAPIGDKSSKLPQNLSCHSTLRKKRVDNENNSNVTLQMHIAIETMYCDTQIIIKNLKCFLEERAVTERNLYRLIGF